MSENTPSALQRPNSTEYAPFYHGYIATVPDGEVLGLLRQQAQELARLPTLVAADREGYAYAPGKWTVQQVVAHLGHAERVFGYRALRFALADPTPLPGFEENAFVANSSPRSLVDVSEELSALRAANLALFGSFTDEQWLRIGVASGTPVSVRALAYIICGHAAHHLAVLRERYQIAT